MTQEKDLGTGYEFKTFKGYLIHTVIVIGLFCALSLNSFAFDPLGAVFYAIFYGLVSFLAALNYIILKNRHLKWYWYLTIGLSVTLASYGLLWATRLVDYRIWGLVNNVVVIFMSIGWFIYKGIICYKNPSDDGFILKMFVSLQISFLVLGCFTYTVLNFDKAAPVNKEEADKLDAAQALEIIKNNINDIDQTTENDNVKTFKYVYYDETAKTLDIGFTNMSDEIKIVSYCFDGSSDLLGIPRNNLNEAIEWIVEKETLPSGTYRAYVADTKAGTGVDPKDMQLSNNFEQVEFNISINLKDSDKNSLVFGLAILSNKDKYVLHSYQMHYGVNKFDVLQPCTGIGYYLAQNIIDAQVSF